MKKIGGCCLILTFLLCAAPGCDTQKPANEVKDAQDRVKQKIEGEREKQNAENPEQQEGSN